MFSIKISHWRLHSTKTLSILRLGFTTPKATTVHWRYLSDKSNSLTNDAADDNRVSVGIFVDLDNQRFETYSRVDAQNFVKPFRTFARAIHGKVTAFQAFGNTATQTYKTPEEKDRLSFSNIEEYSDWFEWDQSNNYTGYDETGTLRCGICGQRMKLTKKDLKRGMDEHDKLHKHMKMLHDREQKKRDTWKKQNKGKVSKSHIMKSEKYKRAQLDTGRAISPGRSTPGNQLFMALKTAGVRCFSEEDVDKKLKKKAREWMKGKLSRDQESKEGSQKALIIVSNDSDFKPLLIRARELGILAVSATIEESQTESLQREADILLRNGGYAPPEALTANGELFVGELSSKVLWDAVMESKEKNLKNGA